MFYKQHKLQPCKNTVLRLTVERQNKETISLTIQELQKGGDTVVYFESSFCNFLTGQYKVYICHFSFLFCDLQRGTIKSVLTCQMS